MYTKIVTHIVAMICCFTALAFSPYGKSLAAASFNWRVRLWQVC
jgi:hypothetical protein